jgi:nitroreductase
VIVVKDPKVKSEVLRTVPETNRAHFAMVEAPVILVLCGKKAVSGYYGGKPATVKGDWLMFDTGLAMQNLCLAAHDLGLGTVIVGLFDHKKAKEILSVPENIEVVAMTPLGYPASQGNPPRRKEFSDFVSYERYHGK